MAGSEPELNTSEQGLARLEAIAKQVERYEALGAAGPHGVYLRLEDLRWLLDEVSEWLHLSWHVETCGVVCWWEGGQVAYQEAPATAGEVREAWRKERERLLALEGTRGDEQH